MLNVGSLTWSQNARPVPTSTALQAPRAWGASLISQLCLTTTRSRRMKLKPLLARLAILVGDQAGQAMVEYSTITFALLIGTAATSFVTVGPNFLNAMNIYLDGVYRNLNYALP